MDDDHHRIVESVAALDRAFSAGGSQVRQAFHALLQETERHFDQQERVMRQNRVAPQEFAAHKAEHDDFLTQLRFFHQRFDTCKVGLHGDVMEFIATWFIAHILGQDRKVNPKVLAQAA